VYQEIQKGIYDFASTPSCIPLLAVYFPKKTSIEEFIFTLLCVSVQYVADCNTDEICKRLSWEVLDRLIIFMEILCHIFKGEVPFGILGLKNNKFNSGLQ
jgi:hypothetical protein